jgi:hypothetical protein
MLVCDDCFKNRGADFLLESGCFRPKAGVAASHILGIFLLISPWQHTLILGSAHLPSFMVFMFPVTRPSFRKPSSMRLGVRSASVHNGSTAQTY